MSNFEPKPFGKYFLTDLIAVGGMAEIYKAKTFGVDGFEKVLAIKKILSHYSADKEFITMLTDEAKLVVNLSHANIVQVYDLGRVANDYFISMEYIDGINLRDLIEKGKELGEQIPPEIIIYITSEVCKGLDYAHHKKGIDGNPLQIVHRDISPQNILVSVDGGVKIVDFGIAKAAMNLSQTNIGTLKGKVSYMSPEQAFGKPIDGRTDLFSLGIILYELLTGKRLFVGESQMEILKKIRNNKVSNSSIGDKVNSIIKPVLVKALAYHPKDRFESSSDMQIALTKLLYSHFSDFSPRLLSDLLHRWFKSEINEKHKGESSDADVYQETILVSSHDNQINLVHHEDDKEKEKIELQETITPEDEIKSGQFLDAEFEGTEKTEKTEEQSSPKLSVETKLAEKQKSKRSFKILFWFLCFVFLLAVTFVFYRQNTNDVKENKEDINFIDDSSEGIGTDKIEDVSQDHSKVVPVLKPDKKIVSNTYKLAINSNPKGASIFLDGLDTQKKTPAKLDQFKIGQTYQLSIQLPYYKVYNTKYISKKTNDQSLDVKLAPLMTSVEILSEPKEAQIFIDDKLLQERTPFKITKLKIPQKTTIRIQKKGYETFRQVLSITTDSPLVLDIKLTKIKTIQKAPLKITAHLKGADVIINDQNMGKTPLSISLKPDRYKVYVQKKGYVEQSKFITVKTGTDLQKLYFKLGKTKKNLPVLPVSKTTQKAGSFVKAVSSTNVASFGKLRVDSQPRGASVRVNGIAKGVTPIVIGSLPKKTPLSVSVSKTGYRVWHKNIRLLKDKTEIKAVLKR